MGASGGAAVATPCRVLRKHGHGSPAHGWRVDLVFALGATLEERGSCGLLHAAPALQQEYAGCCQTCTSHRCTHDCADCYPNDRWPRSCASSGCHMPHWPCKSSQQARPQSGVHALIRPWQPDIVQSHACAAKARACHVTRRPRLSLAHQIAPLSQRRDLVLGYA